VEDFNAVHVSVGDLLRDKADKLLADDGIDLDEYMRNSILVPKEITQKYLETHLINHVRGGKRRFLVDGFPRSMDQALYFKSCVSGLFSSCHNRNVFSCDC